MYARFSLNTLILFAVVTTPSCAIAANLVANPDFDTGVQGWVQSGGSGNFSYDPTDGSPTPGAMRIVAADPSSSLDVASGCIPVDASQRYDLLVQVKTASGDASVSVYGYRNATCTSALGAIGLPLFWPTPIWGEVSENGLALPQGTAAVQILLEATASGIADPSDIRVDHVRFGLTGSAPVVLQNFVVE